MLMTFHPLYITLFQINSNLLAKTSKTRNSSGDEIAKRDLMIEAAIFQILFDHPFLFI